jgi:endonuclease/exonuclease/phosphatase family metal-dependent hydrolase
MHGLLLLFFLQSASSLVESIYILELLNTSLDEKALGVLFFFSPLLLLLFPRRALTRLTGERMVIAMSFALLALGRSVLPYLDTAGSMLASGISTSATLLLIPVLLVRHPQDDKRWLDFAQGLALAVLVSIFLRTINFTMDITLTRSFGWIGWVLVAGLGLGLFSTLRETPLAEKRGPEDSKESHSGLTLAGIGILVILTLVYFAFASPGVIARWTEASYTSIIMAVSLLIMAWLTLTLLRPGLFEHFSTRLLFGWNLLFTVALAGTLLAQRVAFSTSPDAPAVVIEPSTWLQHIPLALMLLTFPVIFIDFAIFARILTRSPNDPRRLAPGFTLGALLMVGLTFMNIFSNVWGYVEPVSPLFRNTFWLSFTLAGALLTLLTPWLTGKVSYPALYQMDDRVKVRGMITLSLILFIGASAAASLTDRKPAPLATGGELVVMTYNIQQGNDGFGQKSYERQLALIREVNPDILGLQESDSARISLGNNDYVRYYAAKLGYWSYYGPTPVTGTYGTALLSKYPLENRRVVFTYSDQDEIGTTVAEMVVDGNRFTIYNVHPDGSDTAMLAFAKELAARAHGETSLIALGDYNLRMWEEPFQVIHAGLKNAWLERNPGRAEENWIDHIFISPDLSVGDIVYLLPPDSATDHPAHWANITWER